MDPARGGRIVSARVAGRELLIGPSAHPENYGSTFWTSPQSDWSWPPVAAIDSGAYEVLGSGSSSDASFVLESATVTGTGTVLDEVRVRKRFSADVTAEALEIEYTLANGGSTKRLAPWEITRVGPFGLTFFEAPGEPWAAPGGSLPPALRARGALWFQYTEAVTHHAKLFSDGNGWIAHVSPEKLLLVKHFADVSSTAFAPEEAEIEVYASNPPDEPEARYVEVENQGAYVTLPPGGSSSWKVRWYLRALPESVAVTPGSAELLRFVERLIGS